MIRHAIVASAALAMISGAAVAGPFNKTETTVQRTAHGTIVTKRHKSLLGKMVTKRKATENTATGSSVADRRLLPIRVRESAKRQRAPSLRAASNALQEQPCLAEPFTPME